MYTTKHSITLSRLKYNFMESLDCLLFLKVTIFGFCGCAGVVVEETSFFAARINPLALMMEE